MVKYLLFLTTLLSLHGTSISHTFYGGVNLGLSVISGKRNDTSTKTLPPVAQKNLTENKGIYKKGSSGGIFAGYLFQFSNFAIGPELFWNYTNISDNLDGQQTIPLPITTSFDIRYRITNQYGINARIGYILQTYFLYALYGLHWQQSNFQVKAKRDAAAGDLREYNYNSSNKIIQCNSFGFGLQKQLSQNYDIGFEYKITNIPKKSYEFKLGDRINTKLNSNASFKLHSFSLRFIFKV